MTTTVPARTTGLVPSSRQAPVCPTKVPAVCNPSVVPAVPFNVTLEGFSFVPPFPTFPVVPGVNNLGIFPVNAASDFSIAFQVAIQNVSGADITLANPGGLVVANILNMPDTAAFLFSLPQVILDGGTYQFPVFGAAFGSVATAPATTPSGFSLTIDSGSGPVSYDINFDATIPTP